MYVLWLFGFCAWHPKQPSNLTYVSCILGRHGSFAAVNPVKPFLYGVLLKRVVHLRVCAEWRLPADPGEWGSMWVNAPVGASTLKLSVDAPTGAFGNCTSGSFSSASSVSAWCRHTLGGTETLRRPGFPSFSSTNSTNVCTTLAFHVGRPAAAAGIMSQLVRGTGSGRQGLNQRTLSRSRVATCHFYTYTQSDTLLLDEACGAKTVVSPMNRNLITPSLCLSVVLSPVCRACLKMKACCVAHMCTQFCLT